jgi:hypothetical protein
MFPFLSMRSVGPGNYLYGDEIPDIMIEVGEERNEDDYHHQKSIFKSAACLVFEVVLNVSPVESFTT